LWIFGFALRKNQGVMNSLTKIPSRSHVYRRLFSTVVVVVLLLAVVPSVALAAGSDVGANVGGLLKHYAGEVYGGIVAAFSLVFLWNRRYTELAVFLFAAIVVAWMVFAPDQIGKAAEAIGKQIFG
jgi:hypothetical protein